MRYIPNKADDDKDSVSNLGKEYNLNPIIENNMLVNTNMGQLNTIYNQFGQPIIANEYCQNNTYDTDTCHISYSVKVDSGVFIHLCGDNSIRYTERKVSQTQRNNLKGGLSHTRKINDMYIEICDAIFFVSGYIYEREDRPGKEYYNVLSFTKEKFDSFIMGNKVIDNELIEKKVIEKSDLNSSHCSQTFKHEIVKTGQEALCSKFFRSEICRVSKLNVKITIPSQPGWYKDEKYGYVFLERERYKDLPYNELPYAMRRRIIGKTDRMIEAVYSDLVPIINQVWQSRVLWGIRLIGSIQIILENNGVLFRNIIAPIVETLEQMTVATVILKTGDFTNFDALSLGSKEDDIKKEISVARDGVAVFVGPMTVGEVKLNGKKVRSVRDSAIGAGGTGMNTRAIISIIGRLLPSDISEEFALSIDYTNTSTEFDVKKGRSLLSEFDAAYISYIENNFNKVEDIIKGRIEQYRSSPDAEILPNRKDMYIMFLALMDIMDKCFSIKLFSEEEFEQVRNLFTYRSAITVEPNCVVIDQFTSVVHKLIRSGKFTIIEKSDANKRYSFDCSTLILDRKKGFLSFPKAALNNIADMLTMVKDGSELADILKAGDVIYCTDNGGRQITINRKRHTFYSVYISELGDEILEIIDFLDKDEFFFEPSKIPENFVPLLWYEGRCAGYMLEGKGLPNPHINISGLSGMGKNRGSYKMAEGYLRLKSKVLFLDIKGGTTLDSLNNMKCDISKYLIYDLKNEGFPFPIFNLSSFDGKNAKVTYILNVIGAAVELTNNQYNDLAVQLESMICENLSSFSLADLYQKLPKNKNNKLKNKLQPLMNIMNSYTPKDGKYKYSSCREFIEDNGKITVLSINQDSLPALHSIVYTLLQSLFEHQVINSSKHLVVYADEMQKYTADSPFKQMYAEAREFRMCNIAMTQEYRAPGNDIKEISSNAAMEIFYIPTNDSEKRVFGKLGKNYSVEEHHQKGVGYIWAKGYFWSKTANGHKYATLKGMNDDSRSSEQQSHPKNKFQLKGRLSRNRRSQSI